METGTSASNRDASEGQERWSARKVQPVVVLYLVAVFVAFVALAHFAFHSSEAVKALAIALVGAIGATVQGVIDKTEYQITESGIEKRPLKKKKPAQFKCVVRWDELSHIVPMKHGFKSYKTLDETNPFRRFWNLHISDRFSGEVHAEKRDLERILEILERRGVAISKPG